MVVSRLVVVKGAWVHAGWIRVKQRPADFLVIGAMMIKVGIIIMLLGKSVKVAVDGGVLMRRSILLNEDRRIHRGLGMP